MIRRFAQSHPYLTTLTLTLTAALIALFLVGLTRHLTPHN